MKRGEIWWARLAPPLGNRMVVLLSRDEVYSRRRRAVVAPITRTLRPIASHVRLGVKDGIRTDSDIDLDTLLTIDVRSLDRIVASLLPERMMEVEAALRFALALK